MKKDFKLFVSFFLVLSLVLQVAVFSLPMSAEEIPPSSPEPSSQTEPATTVLVSGCNYEYCSR